MPYGRKRKLGLILNRIRVRRRIGYRIIVQFHPVINDRPIRHYHAIVQILLQYLQNLFKRNYRNRLLLCRLSAKVYKVYIRNAFPGNKPGPVWKNLSQSITVAPDIYSNPVINRYELHLIIAVAVTLNIIDFFHGNVVHSHSLQLV